MSYTKWIGGALGWALGGPIGAIFGYAFGSIVGDTSLSIEQGPYGQPQGRPGHGPRRRQTGSGDFAASMIVLSAAVMKADERILKSELDYVKRFFVSNFGQQQAERYVLTLREVLKQDVDTRAVCRQIHGLMEHSKRLLLLQYLYGIAQADGHVDDIGRSDLGAGDVDPFLERELIDGAREGQRGAFSAAPAHRRGYCRVPRYHLAVKHPSREKG